MALKAYAPGTRKGNRYYIFRGRVEGRLYEIATKFPATTAARNIRAAIEEAEQHFLIEAAKNRIPRAAEQVTFARAADLYVDYRDPSKPDQGRIRKLVSQIGQCSVDEIRQLDLVAVAKVLHPGRSAATCNREVMRPAAEILYYAARNGLCPWLRIELFREAAPKTRAVSFETAASLISAAPEGPKRLLLILIFRQGTRISDTLRINWQDIDMSRRIERMHVGKTDRWIECPLHTDVSQALVRVPASERCGRLFPWHTKSGVYKWLRPLARDLG